MIQNNVVDFKIDDYNNPDASPAQQQAAKEVMELLRKHSMDAFTREDAGRQFIRERSELFNEDQETIDAEIEDILMDRFPAVKARQSKVINSYNANPKGGSGDDTDQTRRPDYLRNVKKYKKVDESVAGRTLETEYKKQQDTDPDTGKTASDRARENINDSYTIDLQSGTVSYAGTDIPNAQAEAETIEDLSTIVSTKNMASAVESVNGTLAREYNIPNSAWGDKTSIDNLDLAELANAWYPEKSAEFQEMYNRLQNVVYNEENYNRDIRQALYTAAGPAFQMPSPDQRFSEEDARQLAGRLILGEDNKIEQFYDDWNARSAMVLESDITFLPYIRLDDEGQAVSERISGDVNIRDFLEEIVPDVRFYEGRTGSSNEYGYLEKDEVLGLFDGKKAYDLDLISFLPAGARKEQGTDDKIVGEFDPNMGEIVANVVALDAKGNRTGDKKEVVIRGTNVERILKNNVGLTEQQIDNARARTTVANIIDSGRIPVDGFYELTAKDITSLLGTTGADPMTYMEALAAGSQKNLASLPIFDIGMRTSGTDELNIMIRRDRIGDADQYSLWYVKDGLERPLGYPAISDSDADLISMLTVQLHDHYKTLGFDLGVYVEE